MVNSRKACEDESLDMSLAQRPEPFDNNDGPIWVNAFTEDSARAFVKQLQYQSNRDPTAPIIIYIDSFGGDIYALFAMISAMEAVPNQLITIALGKAMSAGAVLLACGDIRYASRHCSIMLHEASSGIGGHIADINNALEHTNDLNEKMLSILAERCKIKGGASAVREYLNKTRDLFLTAEEAVKFGLIDKVGVPTLQKKSVTEWALMMSSRQQLMQETNNEQRKKKSSKSSQSKKRTRKAKV